jgi:hypothetical protein
VISLGVGRAAVQVHGQKSQRQTWWQVVIADRRAASNAKQFNKKLQSN